MIPRVSLLFQEQRNLSEDEVIAREKAELLEEELRQVEAERTRLIIIEDKLRQLLQVLLSLADMVSDGKVRQEYS